jgi:hypothetical protein
VFDWATGLVLSPLVWVGLLLFGLSAVLFVVSGMMRNRAADRTGSTPGEVKDAPRKGALPPSSPPRSEPVIDEDLAEIEAILKKRGIS